MMDENLISQQADSMTYQNLYNLKYTLGRIKNNLLLINATPNANSVTVMNTTMFALAAEWYGDAKQWSVIASANNLSDPMINEPTTLLIPPWNGVDTGGILS